MKISIVTVTPELYGPFLESSLVGRAAKNGLCSYEVTSLLDMVAPKERIDSPLVGHGAGMLIRPEVVERSITLSEQRHGRALRIFFSPHGIKLTQPLIQSISKAVQKRGHLLLFAGRYEGIDARAEEVYSDLTVSVGDYVLLGGDLPAMTLMEALLRYVPGVVGKQASVEADSFSGPFVDHPHYTLPAVWNEIEIPAVLRSGNHGAVDTWRRKQAVERTVLHHFDWLRSFQLSQTDIEAVNNVIPPHYAVLMHDQILLPDQRVGTSSVTSLDIHDIARSARTYGIKHYFLVTPLQDQQRIVQTLLDFWTLGEGVQYNKHRHEAVSLVSVVSSLDDALKKIMEWNHGCKPLLITTSAKKNLDDPQKEITYNDQEYVWAHQRPVVLIFGTAQGLAPELFDRCDYHLVPIKGFSEFNHLSVRSAAAIIFDRWLGIQPRAHGANYRIKNNSEVDNA